MTNYQKKIYYVTQTQYEILEGGGTVGDYTGIDPDATYFVRPIPMNYQLSWDYDDETLHLLTNGADLGSPLTINQASYALEAAHASNASNAETIKIAAKDSGADHYLSFVDDNNSPADYEALYTDIGLKYNITNKTLTVGSAPVKWTLDAAADEQFRIQAADNSTYFLPNNTKDTRQIATLNDISILAPAVHTHTIGYYSTANASDLNTTLGTGQFSWSNSSTNTPVAGSYGQGINIVSTGTAHNNSNNWITQLAFSTANNTAYFRGKTNSGSWGSWHTLYHTGNKPSYSWSDIGSKPSFATVATSGSYTDLSNKPTIPSIPSIMDTTEGNTGTATTQRTISALNLKSIILYHSPAGARPASDVKSWAKADNKPSYTWSDIGSKPSFATVATSGSYNDLSNKPTDLVTGTGANKYLSYFTGASTITGNASLQFDSTTEALTIGSAAVNWTLDAAEETVFSIQASDTSTYFLPNNTPGTHQIATTDDIATLAPANHNHTISQVTGLQTALDNISLTPGPKGDKGDTGSQGPKGDTGSQGPKGDKGDTGTAATVSVGTTTTGAAGTNASVTQTGTAQNRIFNFVIPKGDKGDTGSQGPKGDKGDTGSQGPKGDKGDTGADGLTTKISLNGNTYTQTGGTITLPNYPTTITGNAGSATYASAVTTTAENTGTTSRYILFANSTSGNQALKTDTGLTYHPTNNTLTLGDTLEWTLDGSSDGAFQIQSNGGATYSFLKGTAGTTYIPGVSSTTNISIVESLRSDWTRSSTAWSTSKNLYVESLETSDFLMVGGLAAFYDDLHVYGANVYADQVQAGLLSGGLAYSTSAPTSANTSGIKFYVGTEPATKYAGWIYFIT